MKLEFLEEGYYREGDDQYMSIWTYKRKFDVVPNDTNSNYADAQRMNCNNRLWLPFKQSNRFKEGWHYDLGYLVTFYGHN